MGGQMVCRGSCIYYFLSSDTGAQSYYYESPCRGDGCGCVHTSPAGAPLQRETCNWAFVEGNGGNGDRGKDGGGDGDEGSGGKDCGYVACSYLDREGNNHNSAFLVTRQMLIDHGDLSYGAITLLYEQTLRRIGVEHEEIVDSYCGLSASNLPSSMDRNMYTSWLKKWKSGIFNLIHKIVNVEN